MKKSRRYLALMFAALLLCFATIAQSITINGNVKNSSSKDAVPAVSVTIKGSSAGTFTNEKGDFKLTTAQSLPLTLIISSIGFETKEITVSNLSAPVQVDFVPAF